MLSRQNKIKKIKHMAKARKEKEKHHIIKTQT